MWWKSMPSSSSESKSCNSFATGEELFMASNADGSSTPLNVNEEYEKTLRTKSFLDMLSRVHRAQPPRTVSSITSSPEDGDDGDEDREEASHLDTSPCTDSSHFSYASLLEPSQESLVAAMATVHGRSAHLRAQSLLLEYFDVTFQACDACAKLLASLSRAREHHRSIRHLLAKVSSACFDGSDCCAEVDHLASLLRLDNPLCSANLARFYSVQSQYRILTQRLTRAHRRTLRMVRLVQLTKKAAGIVAVSACSIAVAAALAIAAHTVIGIGVVAAAAPVVMTTRPRAAMRRGRAARARHLERLGAAAKGAYIVGRDFDTMSRTVRRAHDEVEHEREMARMALREKDRQLAREAAREVEGGAARVEEQLEELEEHVYLCLITINRSRSMVAQEVMEGGAAAAAAMA
ncbi:UPF0496 protein [Musa troglodytarum]|uniref:UPF0496 protein n=1 Tax=Musa troglodytarum TaxID=320322 RepID=A0A9E7EAW9_9LILI|nr:UPF0496 protein [Musa troglodytarum]